MAGFTSNISSSYSCFKPLASSPQPSSSIVTSLSFIDSKPISDSNRSVSLSLIIARYGRPNFTNKTSRDTRKRVPDADPAVDMSTLRAGTVRLIDADQNMVGLVSKDEAIQMAENAELDLVILSPDADPPVVKIMDYNKYKYEQQKKKKEQQKKSTATRMDIKEVKMGIDVHDYSVRLRSAQKFLKDGDKVKVIVQLKGRENEFRNNAIELIKRFQNDIGELGTEESKNLRDRNVFVVLVPNKAILQKGSEQPKKREKPEITEEASASV
ncbi:hypothetical protein AQUCO_01600280v1 [Aquilegia coerulea]|uniref:Translation initiation factor IF-3 n=1 Tax=Aquilegia coerulea TaxID=218851 RepID=A0A2G5DQX6_AQUCA|nr:hypothetical protein AQUCO_01600280v1 [Aquilegia coerulea]